MRLASGGKLLARRVTPALRKEIIEQLWIVTACVVDGRYFAAGEVTPYAHESDLPESLKGLVARGDEDFYHPSQRDIYQGQPAGPEPGFIFQGASNAQWVQRQAAQTAAGLQEQAWAAAEAAAANELPEEVKEVLEAEHDRSVQRDSNRFVGRTL